MGSLQSMPFRCDRSRLVRVYFLFYFAVFFYQALNQRLLAQVQPALFSYNRDLAELALIATGLPRWMIAHPLSFVFADVLVFLLPLTLLIDAVRARRLSTGLCIVFILYLAIYQLLADLFWNVHHEPFILYFLLPLAFLTKREDRFRGVMALCRYYFLFVFVSAAIWKIARGAVFNGEEMSRILLIHHSDLLSGDCSGILCRTYSWLIDHTIFAQGIYVGGVLLELSFLAGFFTRRYDRLLIALAVVFVLADWLVMQIPYWTILLGVITLWPGTRPRRPMMVIYETTHHENLPALLDCSEMQFERVVVFLKDISFRNISGRDSPGALWPKTEFIVQAEGRSNRNFIRALFRFLRQQQSSHLHLATLDNNLLLFALRIGLYGSLQVSLTVHEVNEYFACSFATLRATTEALAKWLLHRRIRHYHFFLPAIAERFRQRMPDAVTVFIPSRFYRAPMPLPGADDRVFTVVIPGSVDGNRRDYAFVVECFRHWPATSPLLQLLILGDCGNAYGADIVAHLQQLESAVFQMRCYQGYIPQAIYEQAIEEAGVLWSPLFLDKKGSRSHPETYGQTTASGLTADILLNNVPALVPMGFGLDEPFQTALLPYGSAEEVVALLRTLAADEDHRLRIRQRIHLAFSGVIKENFRQSFVLLAGFDPDSQEGAADAIEAVHQAIQ